MPRRSNPEDKELCLLGRHVQGQGSTALHNVIFGQRVAIQFVGLSELHVGR